MAWLGLPEGTCIDSVDGTASDAHAGGHVVLRLVFKGGVSVYYKPRRVTGEWLWHALLQAIAGAEPGLRLPAPRVLTEERGFAYGWVESALAASSAVCGADYWHAAGATLCLAQHVRLTDLHLGNLVATPAGPAVTDAECLATPSFSSIPDARSAAEDRAMDSLLLTGLLSRRDATGVHDVSGLFGKAGPVTGLFSGLRLPLWVGDSGGFRLVQAPAMIEPHGNAPVETSAIAVLPQLLAGYRHASDVLLHCRAALTGSGARWRRVLETAHAPRVVLRDTLTYALAISESLAPANAGTRKRRGNAILSRLQSGNRGELPKAIVRSEVHALMNYMCRACWLCRTRAAWGTVPDGFWSIGLPRARRRRRSCNRCWPCRRIALKAFRFRRFCCQS